MSNPIDLEAALATAKQATEIAAEISLSHFKKGVRPELKADRSVVTAADRAAEDAIIEKIEADFPDHAILGEETGARPKDSDFLWIVDPIDGTRGFCRGGEFWGPLIALSYKGEVLVGSMALPVRGEFYWAHKGGGTFKNGRKLQVSTIDSWQDATLSLGETTRLVRHPEYGQSMVELISTAASTRAFGDLAGAAQVLDGRAEVWFECGVKPWDLAPSRILMTEAGGRWTTFKGANDDLNEGTAIGSNGLLHEHALNKLTRQ